MKNEMQKYSIRKKVYMFGRKWENRETRIIPGTCNDTMEDDTQLEWYILVIDPSYHRPELHLHPLEIVKKM